MRISLGLLGVAWTSVVFFCGGFDSSGDLEVLAEDHRGIPTAPGTDRWAEIPALETREPARPAAFVADERPRLVIFGGSWCPGCLAGMLHDAELSRRFRGRIDVVFAVRSESDERFMQSNMARWFSDMPVYSEASTASLTERCEVPFVPYACLLEGERVHWSGGAADAPAVLEAFLGGNLEARVGAVEGVDADYAAALGGDVQARERVFTTLRGFADRENGLAWDLVDRPAVAPNERWVALGLAQDATNATSGLDAAILDTYAVALASNDDTAGAARVARRVIEVCDALGTGCAEERPRAEQYIAAVR